MNEQRLQQVRSNLRLMDLDQMVIVDPVSIAYLTGYKNDPMERFQALYVAADNEPTIFVNKLFPDPSDYVDSIITLDDTDDPIDALAQLCIHDAPLGIDRGLEARWLLPLMDAQAASAYRLASSAVDDARAHKDPTEQQAMAEASAINDQGMAWLESQIREGVTERQIAEGLEAEYRRLGAWGNSFAPIVSFGANAADPHHEPDDTKLTRGQCVLFDVGCAANDYCADMTRTFFFGEPSEEFERVHATVVAANRAAEAMVAPGVTFAQIDAAARQVIEDAGYGPYFTHRLGHSIGLEVHEPGDVSSAHNDPVEPGMCFSIEPGIYLPGRFGVRIEDLVIVTQDGCQVLNHYPKDLECIKA
ncbi:Xaa-Pro peptidase family protein [Leptogranulimonas caecicola]|jgi:Xaa-Pro dipeptidase|uniref:Aminopeptidase P family protein n=2 Tax=Coriobacteriales TaxID=84999 RepID=A0A4S2F2N2_9ACTN|nr:MULTISPECIES: Xaa-Pro peptidase family protein [Atopobiaceae]MCI8675580.1 aminopeptidase P family protein [Atopobiaceae bacterium]TGY62617.1 aminopeptidase P family protein [Muricaecibacterium torontonense]BDC90568.1 proline dipeptidase [Leptogranulimonas caecicola]